MADPRLAQPARARGRRRRTPLRRPLAALTALLITAIALIAVPGGRPAAAVACGDLATPVLHRVQPTTQTSLLTTSASEARRAGTSYGFSQDRGVAFQAAHRAQSGLVGVHRLYLARSGDFRYTANGTEVSRAVARGYVDQGVRFYAATRAAACLVAVRQFTRSGRQQLAAGPSRAAALTAAGWQDGGTVFYARPAGSSLVSKPIRTTKGTTFSFAVVPDTQMEVLSARDQRLANRSAWVVKQKRMSFLLQTGDLVNWDTPDHRQWVKAKAGLSAVERARLPYTLAVGNHDTMATGVGGSARDARRVREQLRDTTTLNAFFQAADFRGVGGEFERGKVDNIYARYRAGGVTWMVLTLEFCPRASAVAWARRVVAAHPQDNVIISTHYYLTGGGRIGTRNAGYGDTSPTYLWRQLVRQYPNIKFVFSGHVGKARKARVDRGVHGNKIYSFLTTMHDRRTNPTRVVTIDTKRKTLTTRVYAPATKKSYPKYSQTIRGLRFVR